MSDTNLTPVDDWSDVPQIEITDVVLGGAGQIANAQAQALANRTLNLKNTVTANKNTQDNKNTALDSAIENLNNDKVNKSDIVNNSSTTASGKVLDGRMGKTLNDLITSNYNTLNTNKINKSDIVTNYTTNNTSKVLAASVAVLLKALIDGKQPTGSYVLTSNVVNNTTTTTGGKVLDGRVGKTLADSITSNYNTLNTNKINKSDIVTNYTTNNTTKVLSASVGYALKGLIDTANTNINAKLAKSDVVNNLTTTASGKALDARQGKALNDAKIDKTSIVDNLTSTDATKVLSAKQGKALKDLIDFNASFSQNIGTLTNITNYNLSTNTNGLYKHSYIRIGKLQICFCFYAGGEHPANGKVTFPIAFKYAPKVFEILGQGTVTQVTNTYCIYSQLTWNYSSFIIAFGEANI